jgi:hypothetical protein
VIANFGDVYIAAAQVDTTPVAMYCDLCGKEIMPPDDNITLAAAIQAAALHQAAEHG